MPVQNSEIEDIFNKLADLLDIEGANPFRVRAYRNAARTVSDLPGNISEMVEKGRDLSEIPGIGKDLAEKIREIVETGTLSQLEEMESKTPPGLNQLLKIDGLGPRRVQALNRELGITSLEELKEAADKGKIRNLEGFGNKTEQSILESIRRNQGREERIRLADAEKQAEPFTAWLKESSGVKKIAIAGSYRRRKETVGDLDILVTCKKDSNVMKRFVEYEDVRKVVSQGKSRSTVILRSGLHVDLCVVPQVSYGAALHYFTGSKSHNIALRKLGVDRGLKINEYGIFQGKKRIAGKTENEFYAAMDMSYIEPEIRENQGEIEAARNNTLPELVKNSDILGDLHCHTRRTDGRHSLEEMAGAAQKLGYKYLAVTEHSKRVSMARGLDAGGLWEQIKEIDRLNEKFDDFTLLKGIEADILKDGSLDLPDDILKQLDIVVCSVHYHRNLPQKQQTERIIRAMDNRCFNILGHPTGRLINKREPYKVDLEKIMNAAAQRGCFLELNAHPDRLDIADRYCRMAREMNVRVAVSTDAHSSHELEYMRLGIDQARRGWLGPRDIINTRNVEDLRQILKR